MRLFENTLRILHQLANLTPPKCLALSLGNALTGVGPSLWLVLVCCEVVEDLLLSDDVVLQSRTGQLSCPHKRFQRSALSGSSPSGNVSLRVCDQSSRVASCDSMALCTSRPKANGIMCHFAYSGQHWHKEEHGDILRNVDGPPLTLHTAARCCGLSRFFGITWEGVEVHG